MKTKQFTLYLENKPGVLANITERLADEGVNIDGISVAASTDVALVQIVTSHAAQTRRILKKAGIPATDQDVLLIALKNEPGSLFNVVSKLAKCGVNLNYVYATGCTCKNGCKCYAIISADNLSAVEKLCK